MPKIIPLPMVHGDSRRRWKMIEKWFYQAYDKSIHIPKNFIFDGASIPRIFTRIYSPTGYLFLSALIHDFCYQRGYYYECDTEAYYNNRSGKDTVNWKKKAVTRKEADQLFKAIAKIEYPKHVIKTAIAYTCLRIGGWVAWNRHRKE